jgi:hypothetical protein
MLIGIISDSHDNLVNLEKALVILQARKVEHILHAGDYVSPFTARVLKKFTGGFTGIFGNNDGEKLFLRKMFNDTIHPQPHILTLHDRKIVMMHEHDLVDALADSGHFDLVVYGHTHKAMLKKVNKTLVINPGELGGWLYGTSSFAVADLEIMEGEIIPLE